MILKEIETYSRFRGLQPGFKIQFVRPEQAINKVNPVCLVGLNGSGKSNVMQLLAQIFYYLELYVLPDSQGYFNPRTQDGFRICYSLPVTPRNFINGVDDGTSLSVLTWRHVQIDKKENELPVFEYWYDGKEKKNLPADLQNKLLPNQVIGYSSGMNELISLPFLKMDFYYLSMMRRKMEENNRQSGSEEMASSKTVYTATNEMTVNRLFYLDYHSNAMMMLANYLASEDTPDKKSELEIINTIVGIQDLVSFQVSVNFRVKDEIGLPDFIRKMLVLKKSITSGETTDFINLLKDVEIPPEINRFINVLVDCSTTLHTITENDLGDNGSGTMLRMEMHFKVDEEMKRAFRDKVRGGAMQLFQQFYLLNLLNVDNYSKETQQEVKSNEATNLDVKSVLSGVAKEDKVFLVDNIRLKKKNGVTIFYSQLSDGEHQYIQVAGALKLMTEDATLFLMDEPETHFNPEWRSKLISTLNEILDRRMNNDIDYTLALKDYKQGFITEAEFNSRRERYIPKQEIILTTHSPFVVSDCQPENVYIFERDKEKGVQYRKPGINTYGTSSHLLLKELFKSDATIANVSKKEIEGIEEEIINAANPGELEAIKKKTAHLGDSVEKFLMYYKLNTKQKELEDSINNENSKPA